MSKIVIKVLGGGREVGRAALAVGDKDNFLLMDYGVNFNENDQPQFPYHINPRKILLLAITHAHLDHIGAAPFLYTSLELPVMMTSITSELSEVMLQDFLKLSGYYVPYERRDIDIMLNNLNEVHYGKEYSYDGLVVKFLNAGHIPGSAMIYAEINGVRVIYTGDVNTITTKLVEGASLEGISADVLITEGTYGNSIHPRRDSVEKEFIKSVEEVINKGGNVLIPAFSLGRSQELMCLLAENLPEANVFFDGMIRTITEIMISHPEYVYRYDLLTKATKYFKPVRNSGERRKIVKGKGNVVISSAGMLKGGPARYYIKKIGNSEKNAVFMVSYQAPNTPGRMLFETGKFSEGSGLLKARLQWFDFSSHSGVDGLVKLASSIKELKKIVIVHSDENVGVKFKERLSDIFGRENIYFPKNNDTLQFEF